MSESPSFLNPARFVASLEIARGAVVADFGAGSGFYAIPLAEKVGPEGKVYAFDIQPQAVDRIRASARLHHLLNIDAVRADLETERGTRLKDHVADAVIAASILHQVADPGAVLREAARITKPGRMLVVVEWDLSKFPGGPKMERRIPKLKARQYAEAAGFMMDREVAAGSHHYALLFRRN